MLLVLKWNNTYNDLCSLTYQKGFLNPFLSCLNLYFAFVKAALVYVGIFLRKILYFFPFQLYTITSLPSTEVLCLVTLTLKNRGDEILGKKSWRTSSMLLLSPKLVLFNHYIQHILIGHIQHGLYVHKLGQILLYSWSVKAWYIVSRGFD